eukprot:TRINITY_DN29669_c0_g1_i1.p1 TRINITY_DN29669_c0_g1~~TRINITY_DN29669_c0_g1_i1.p1  ORF type:complete len:223 (-),score=21.91 TRINITY_DN29669_c0_g1_i1:22-690(-)
MGAHISNLKRCIKEEFQRLKQANREYLGLDEILKMKLPLSNWMVDLKHLGVLYVLDAKKDGKFTLDELYSFAKLAAERIRMYQPHEFQSQVQGYCSLVMWKAVCVQGNAMFVEWMCDLVRHSCRPVKFPQRPRESEYLYRDNIEVLHHVLNVKDAQGMDFQSFLDMLQQVAEDRDLMELNDERFDDWLPVEVFRVFVNSMIHGMFYFMVVIYPVHEIHIIML